MKERRSKVGTRRGVAGWDGKQKRQKQAKKNSKKKKEKLNVGML